MNQATRNHSPGVAPHHAWFWELLLRLVGAALQILSTWALVRALTPEDAGIYFRGFVISLGLSALLRGKYELYMAQRILGRFGLDAGVSNGALLMQLSRRMLVRSSLLCAMLLVLTADIDIQAPQLQTVLQTYLPFVLALPCVSLSGFVGEALRAANRTLGNVMATYAVNVSILLAVLLAPPAAPLALYSWAFLLGALVAAAMTALLAWQAFPVKWSEAALPIARDVLLEVDARESIGLARGVQLWGPLCILSVFATSVQMAQYAVAARTSQIVDYFLPSLNLAGGRETLFVPNAAHASQGLPIAKLVTAVLYSSLFVVPLLLLAPMTLALYGNPYAAHLTIYALLLGVQWANGVGRPAIRYAVAKWDLHRIARAIRTGALAAVLLCAVGITHLGALAAAGATLVGAVLLNGGVILKALSDRPPVAS